jgi:hypothetical protein
VELKPSLRTHLLLVLSICDYFSEGNDQNTILRMMSPVIRQMPSRGRIAKLVKTGVWVWLHAVFVRKNGLTLRFPPRALLRTPPRHGLRCKVTCPWKSAFETLEGM